MSSRFLGRLALLVLAAAVIPACGSKKKAAPNVIEVSPSIGATSVPHFPLIILQFDADMDPATITSANVRLIKNLDGSPFGPGWTVVYKPALRQAWITPGGFLLENTVYDVTCTSGVTNTDGTAIAFSDAGEVIENQFTTTVSTTGQIPPSFGPVGAATGATGAVDLTWAQATVSALPMSGTYDIYFATATGAEDLLHPTVANRIVIAAGASNPTGFSVTGLAAGVTYFFVVVAHDSNGNILVTGEASAAAGP